MKYLLIAFLSYFTLNSVGQSVDNRSYEQTFANNKQAVVAGSAGLSNDTNFNAIFYNIDLEVALDSSYIQGSVSYILVSEINGLNSIKLDLDSVFSIDSISSPSSSYSFSNNVIKINFTNNYNIWDTISFTIYYRGMTVLAGGYKSLRYETHDGNEPIIATLSTPYLAHTWWPCKDGTSDKADSTYINITVKDTVISNLQLIAVSNGLLDTVETKDNKKTFRWRHTYPCVPYYIMMAISNYDHFQQVYQDTNYSFPIDYYVFSSHKADAQAGVAMMPDAISYFTSIFGPYPFLREKYGMTQLGYYGAIENQTNTIINNMSIGWFYTSVHELAHQWFGDMITCDTWHNGWLNEGFASYAEALYAEHVGGYSAYMDYMAGFKFYDDGTIYMQDVSNPYTVFQPIIYNKGAYVLHMLRGVLGDSVFFAAIKTYATNSNFMYKNASTEDFQAVCENVSGQNLDYFFDQWIYDRRYPMYNYDFEKSCGQEYEIAIEQVQQKLNWRIVFKMPLDILVEYSDGSDSLFTYFVDSQNNSYGGCVGENVVNVKLDPNNKVLCRTKRDLSVDVGIDIASKEPFYVYPNPNKGIFIVKLPRSDNGSIIQFRINDLSGKQIYFSENSIGSNSLKRIDISSYNQGVYILHYISGGIAYHKKIIVVK